jgi:hypothetical protein
LLGPLFSAVEVARDGLNRRLTTAKIRVCSVVDTDVPHWSACRDIVLPLGLAQEEKLLAFKRSFFVPLEPAPLLCRGRYAQMARSVEDKVFGAMNLNRK